jgi:carboxyl-terminal processing protease
MKTNLIKNTVWLLCLPLLFVQCKNENDPGAAADVRDSVYYFSTELYLWRENLPNLNSVRPSQNYQDPEAVMDFVRTFSPKNRSGASIDRWSFVSEKEAWNRYVAGIAGDFGIRSAYRNNGTELRVASVYANSPLGLAGVRRGWRILRVNGVEGRLENAGQISTELGKESVAMDVQKPDGTTQTLNVRRAEYRRDYVQNVRVINNGGQKVGYLSFAQFFGTAEAELRQALGQFRAEGVQDLVIDLRYNGGGSVDIAIKLCNMMAPTAASGKLMFNESHNSRYARWNKSFNFDLSNNLLNARNIVFITTSNTASASELVIANMMPYANVKLVGTNTHGKCTGMYTIPVMNYYAAPIAFKSINAAGFTDYYEGIPVDKTQSDDVTRDFGDPEEACLKDALAFLRTGQMPASLPSERSARSMAVEQANAQLSTEPVGMFHVGLPQR